MINYHLCATDGNVSRQNLTEQNKNKFGVVWDVVNSNIYMQVYLYTFYIYIQ